MISKEPRSRPFPHLALKLHSAATAFATQTCPQTPLFYENAAKNGGPKNKCMTVLLLLLRMLITSKQAAILSTIKGSIGPSQGRHAPHDTPKLHHLNRRGDGKIEGYKCGGWRKRCSLLRSIHCENKRPVWTPPRGRAAVFRAFRTPLGPLPPNFHLFRVGGGQDVRQLLGRFTH